MGRNSKRGAVTLKDFNGDHGTGTRAATRGTKLEELTTENGKNPNKIARRRRVNRLDDMLKRQQLTMRQHQAGMAIQEAWCRVEMLSSGGEMKERVQSSPKPDATIAVQTDAVSRLKFVMDAVPSAMRDIVEHVCWHNRAISQMGKGRVLYDRRADLQVALDLVANKLRY